MTTPQLAHAGDAGFDLHAAETVTLKQGEYASIRTGARNLIPEGHVGMICPRSGLAAKHGITVLNAPGIIDSGYEGEIEVVLINHGKEMPTIHVGDRIAQLVILALPNLYQQQQPTTQRGEGGFGSTGA